GLELERLRVRGRVRVRVREYDASQPAPTKTDRRGGGGDAPHPAAGKLPLPLRLLDPAARAAVLGRAALQRDGRKRLPRLHADSEPGTVAGGRSLHAGAAPAALLPAAGPVPGADVPAHRGGRAGGLPCGPDPLRGAPAA